MFAPTPSACARPGAGRGLFLVSLLPYPDALDDRLFGTAAAALYTYAWRGDPTAAGQKRACYVCGQVWTRARMPAAFVGFEGDFSSTAAEGAIAMAGLCAGCACDIRGVADVIERDFGATSTIIPWAEGTA